MDRVSWNLPTLKDLFVKAWANWSSDNVPRLAAAFAFYAILSLAPMLVLAVVGAGYFYGHSLDAKHALLTQAKDAFGAQGAKLLSEMIDSANKGGSSTIATLFSLLVTFFSASNLFIQVTDTVNAIWGIRVTGNAVKNLIFARLVAFAAALVVGAGILVWLGVDSWLGWLEKHTQGFQGWQGISFLVAFVFLTGLFGISFKALPPQRMKWRDVWPGAILTGFLVSVTKLLLSLYFANFNVSAAYGSAGALVIILLWIYYTSQIYFFGVELTFVYAHEHGSLKGVDESGLQRS